MQNKGIKIVKGVIKRKYSYVDFETGYTKYKWYSDLEFSIIHRIANFTPEH